MKTFETELKEINECFNTELGQFLKGELKKGHIFKLGLPGEILQSTGFPPEQEIELAAKKLKEKSQYARHPFNPNDLMNLVIEINKPLAVFSYGDQYKAQNVIIEINKNRKNYLIGIHFNQEHRGVNISDIRTIFPKDNHEWVNWINQGKLLYANKEKLQDVITQQRMNSAEVE